ncbi:MAG: YggT family protein [Myxococcota bacterium]
MSGVVLLIELYMLTIAVDVGLGWVQPDPTRLPRRIFHALTEPPQRALRAALSPTHTAGIDLSPAVILTVLVIIRVWLVTCCMELA